MVYGRAEFEILLKGYGCFACDYYDVRDDGVWPVRPWTELPQFPGMPEFDLQWCPGCDLEGDDKSDPLRAPALPFPFTAEWLAAWMLDGWGAEIRIALGEWDDGPDQRELDRRLPAYARRVREAIRAAFQVYRQAAALLTPSDGSLEIEARRASDRLDRYEELGELASEDARAAYELASRGAERARIAWRTQMVQQLLRPRGDVNVVTAQPPSTSVRSTTTRKNGLSAIIKIAIQNAPDPDDPSSAWFQLVAMAQEKPKPVLPLIGYVEGEGVQYQDGEEVKWLSRKNFGDRFSRANARAKGAKAH